MSRCAIFERLIRKPAHERHLLTSEEIIALREIDLNSVAWTASKSMRAVELMQTALKQSTPKDHSGPELVRVARVPGPRAKVDGVDIGVPEGWELTLMEDGLFITRLGDGEWISHAHEKWTIHGKWRKSEWGELSEEGALYRIPWPNKELEALRALG